MNHAVRRNCKIVGFRSTSIKSPMSKTIAYLRVSTQDQAESGLGIEGQLQAIRDTFGEPDLIFTDEGISGSSKPENRPGLSAALQALKRGDRLVVADVDRLARWFDLCFHLKYDLEQNRKVALLDAEGILEEGRERLHLRAMFAEMERQKAIERTTRALRFKKAKGEKLGGKHAPFGWRLDVDGVHLIEDPQEQQIIQDIVKLQRRGWSLRQIGTALEERGIKTKTGKTAWNPKTVSALLKRAA